MHQHHGNYQFKYAMVSKLCTCLFVCQNFVQTGQVVEIVEVMKLNDTMITGVNKFDKK